MKIDPLRYEAFALKLLEKEKQQYYMQGGVQFRAVGESLGMSHDEITDCVVTMQEEGYVKLDYRPDPPVLNLTKHGREQIAKFRWSRPRRWWDANSTKVVAWVGAVVSILTVLWSVFGSAIKHWLGF